MAYETGTFTSLTDLRTKIFTFLTTNSWTQEGTNILKRNGVFAELVVESDGTGLTARDILKLTGAKKSDGAGNLLYKPTRANGDSGWLNGAGPSSCISEIVGTSAADIQLSWPKIGYPATYNFHLSADPDEFWCFIQYNHVDNGLDDVWKDVLFHQYLGFGNIVKATEFTGGGFYSAMMDANGPLGTPSSNGPTNWRQLRISAQVYCGNLSSSGSGIIPFAQVSSTGSPGANNTFSGTAVHAEIGGLEWLTGGRQQVYFSSGSGNCFMNEILYQTRDVSENSFNGNLTFVPFNIFTTVADGNQQKVGHSDDLRFCRIKHVTPGQVESDGTDSWKIYPLWVKNSTTGDPGIYAPDSGTYGLAVKYDGP
jgi:hypothetical protein